MLSVIVIGGGQSGIAAAAALLREGLRPLVLEASAQPTGSWPRYYDRLVLFTPARLDGLPGRHAVPRRPAPLPDPRRDGPLPAHVRGVARLRGPHGSQVAAVTQADREYRVHTADGAELTAAMVVAATGSHRRPHRPRLPGLDVYTSRVLHSADHRDPAPFAGLRVVGRQQRSLRPLHGVGPDARHVAARLRAR